MQNFQKRPVIIQAVPACELLLQAAHDWPALPECIRDAYEKGNIVFAAEAIHIKTLEGTMVANPDDWVIRGIQGELYPCKQDIFADCYEIADTPEAAEDTETFK